MPNTHGHSMLKWVFKPIMIHVNAFVIFQVTSNIGKECPLITSTGFMYSRGVDYIKHQLLRM